MRTAALRSASLVDVTLDPRAPVRGGRGGRDRVGLTEIEMPDRAETPDGVLPRVPARVDAFVSLDDPAVKRIQMSRLFLLAQQREKELLSVAALETLLRSVVASRADTSRSAFVDDRFESLLERAAG